MKAKNEKLETNSKMKYIRSADFGFHSCLERVLFLIHLICSSYLFF
jgi:hypothetical protein